MKGEGEDSGILGELKTVSGRQETTTSGGVRSVYLSKGANRATPFVQGDTAHFEFHPAYTVSFPGVGWSYATKAKKGLSVEPVSGYEISLTPPGGGVYIKVKKLDCQVPQSMSGILGQVSRSLRKPWDVEEFLLPKTERAAIAQWALEQFVIPGLRSSAGAVVSASPDFQTQDIGNREFVVATMRNSASQTPQAFVYGLNSWVYQDPQASGRYRAIIWVASLSFEPDVSDTADAIERFQAIPKSLSFHPHFDLAYSDLQ